MTALVQRGAIRTMTKTLSPPTPSAIRLTITVTPEVHAAFSRMAEVSSLPVGRCMGDWLADTLEGAEFLTAQLIKAREAPRQVIREMRQSALGVSDELADLLSKMQTKGAGPAGRASAAPHAATVQTPRPVIRGVKSTRKAGRTGGKS